MMKDILFLSIFIFTFLAFSPIVYPENAKDVFEHVTENDVIVPEDRAKDFYRDASAYFTPTKDEILQAESKLVVHLKSYHSLNSDLVIDSNRLGEYKRQYVGVVLDGKKKLWMNFFCDSVGEEWKSELFSARDGGACFFNVLYDIDTGELSNLHFNGAG